MDLRARQQLHKDGKLTGKVIVRMEVPAAEDKQYSYPAGVKKVLVRAEKLILIGYYD